MLYISANSVLGDNLVLLGARESASTARIISWASYQIRKIARAHAPGMPGTFSPSPQVSDPDMHHGTCDTHVPWCMSGSLTSGFLWNRRRGKTLRMRNMQFNVSGKRPMVAYMYGTVTCRIKMWPKLGMFVRNGNVQCVSRGSLAHTHFFISSLYTDNY